MRRAAIGLNEQIKKEKPYCECFVPISIDKWFDRIHIKLEMNMLLQRIYQKIGRLEGLTALLEHGEVGNSSSLIGRINVMHCRTDEEQSLGVKHFFSNIYKDESVMEAYESQIMLYSDINVLRYRHREKFIILKNTIWALRKEFHPVSPGRIGDCIDHLLDTTSKYANSFRKHNEALNPILFSGLLFYQLLTMAPYEKNNILYSACAVEKYMQKLQMLSEVTIPFAKFIQDNINECDDRMAETRQACNMNQ